MELPLAIVLDGDASARDAAVRALRSAGVDAVVAPTPQDALEIVRAWVLASDPPRRFAREDVPALARSFVEALRRLNRLPAIAIAPDAMAALCRFDWKGDTARLRQAVETAVIVATDATVRAKDLPAFVLSDGAGTSGGPDAGRRFRAAKRTVVDAFERAYLSDLLERHRGNVTAAAEAAGMLRSALQRLLRKHELRSSAFRGAAPGEPGVP